MKTKIRRYCTPARLLASLGLLVLIVFSAQIKIAFGQAFSQGYGSDESLQRGMIVRILQEDTTKVASATQETSADAYGVVVNKNDAPATISNEGEEVFVANDGKYEILVSTQNGLINPGDYIVISSLNGIGMKVDEVQPVVVGRALDGFEGGGDSVSSAEINETPVEIGRVQADIGVTGNPLQKPPDQKLPEILRNAAEDIANKPVSTTRIYLSLALLLVSSLVSGVLLYGGIRSAIVSVGRNPLSKKSIVKGMIQVVIVGMLIFIVGVFGVYLLLKL